MIEGSWTGNNGVLGVLHQTGRNFAERIPEPYRRVFIRMESEANMSKTNNSRKR